MAKTTTKAVNATKAVKATKTTKSTKAVATTTMAKKTMPVVANLAKVTNQVSFLEKYLRGTGRTLSAAQARANYGIGNLAARMSEFRQAGLKVLAAPNTTGKVAYSVSARDVKGSRASKFSA